MDSVYRKKTCWNKAQQTGKGYTPPKTNMDTQNDGLEKVTTLKNCNFWYLYNMLDFWSVYLPTNIFKASSSVLVS